MTALTGWRRDGHDLQWEAFRNNIPTLFIFILFWKGFSLLFEGDKPNSRSWAIGGLFVLYTFRGDSLWYFSIILLWFGYSNSPAQHWKYFVASLWGIILITLYLNEQLDHFRAVSWWADAFLPSGLDFFQSEHRAIHCSQFLNMTFLKLYSYSADKARKNQQGGETHELNKHLSSCSLCSSQ